MYQSRRDRTMGLGLAVVVVCLAATAAQGDFFLVQKIDLNSFFGPLGNNPYTITFDGTYAYAGGFNGGANPRDVGVLKINIFDPSVDFMALEPGGTQTVNQWRYYHGMVFQNGVLYALLDRPDGLVLSTNVRAIDVATGALVDTFDGDFGDGNGIVAEPAALPFPALGGLAFDPGSAGVDSGLSLLAWSSGRRSLIGIDDGVTIYDTSDGMIVTDITGSCTVSDASAWRDHVYDDTGNVYMRRSNQVQAGFRSGPNAISGYAHLTDELNADGTPKVGCGDGMPVAVRVAPFVVGQHLALISATSAGTDEDLIIFNDRPATFSQGDRPFADTVKLITTGGALPNPFVELLRDDGSPLTTIITPDGVGLYDFHYDAAGDLLLILDYSNRNLLVFSGTQPCNSPAQDSDGDGDIDLTDYAAFAECFNGPGQPWPGPPVNQAYCSCVDRGSDGDVDLVDLWLFQQAFTGLL
ncbi:MAG: hypothetical protein GY778_06755 [bacterium]|nr:hypothetical protein [bacterium]